MSCVDFVDVIMGDSVMLTLTVDCSDAASQVYQRETL